MPDFLCPHCQANNTARALRVLGETSQHYTPYELRLLCQACGKLATYKLEYQITLTGVQATKEVRHAE